MTSSKRFALDRGTELEFIRRAEAWGVTIAAAADTSTGWSSKDPVAAERSRQTAEAWESGQALAWMDLVLPPSTMRTLTVSLGAWVAEPRQHPFARDGYGVAHDWEFGSDAVAGSARGFWRAAFPAGAIRVAPFRYGRGVGHFIGADWQRDERGYIYAGTMLSARDGHWVDVDTNDDRGPLSATDHQIDEVLRTVICYPSLSSNPVRWSGVDGVRA